MLVCCSLGYLRNTSAVSIESSYSHCLNACLYMTRNSIIIIIIIIIIIMHAKVPMEARQ